MSSCYSRRSFPLSVIVINVILKRHHPLCMCYTCTASTWAEIQGFLLVAAAKLHDWRTPVLGWGWSTDKITVRWGGCWTVEIIQERTGACRLVKWWGVLAACEQIKRECVCHVESLPLNLIKKLSDLPQWSVFLIICSFNRARFDVCVHVNGCKCKWVSIWCLCLCVLWAPRRTVLLRGLITNSTNPSSLLPACSPGAACSLCSD